MPKTNKGGEPIEPELPSTIQRSDDKAKRTFAKTHDSALESYGDEERANRTAYAALKHTHEKVGDHWEPKEGGRKGPSDERAEKPYDAAGNTETAGGVDANASVSHLRDLAKRLEIPGRSRMSKDELVEALQKANDAKTREAREAREAREKA